MTAAVEATGIRRDSSRSGGGNRSRLAAGFDDREGEPLEINCVELARLCRLAGLDLHPMGPHSGSGAM